MTGRHALIVATYDYRDAGLKKLIAPRHDAQSLAEVLADRDIAGFDVTTLVNEPHHVVGEAIGDFFATRRREELCLLYFTGHGLKDDEGRLFLAMVNTRRDGLLFTALSAQSINEAMNDCRAREKILILDCCHSGAFPGGYSAKADPAVNTLERFAGGRGKVVLTASDATQYSFEGNQLSGVSSTSVFTRHLVEGLRSGAADQDEDGDIALDELYSYVYERVVAEMPQQRPKKQDDVEGRIVIAHNIRWDLPGYVRSGLASPIPGDRLQALTNLARLHANGNPAVRARVTARLAELLDDDSKQVSQGAAELLRRLAPAVDEAELARRLADEQQLSEAEETQQRRSDEPATWKAERPHRQTTEPGAQERAAQQWAAAELPKQVAATEQRPRPATEKAVAGEVEEQPQAPGGAGLLGRSPPERPTVDDAVHASMDFAAQDGSSTAAAFSETSSSGDDPRRGISPSPGSSSGPSTVLIGQQQLTGHTGWVRAVATAQLNGRPVVVSGSLDGTVRVWDMATGQPVGDPFTGHTDGVTAVATAQLNGRPVVVSGSLDGTVRVWDLDTHTPIGEPLTGHIDSVFAVATAQLNGRPVAVSGSRDYTVRVWDLATGKPVGSPCTGHIAAVRSVTTAQLDGGSVVVSGSDDKTVRVWDLATGHPIRRASADSGWVRAVGRWIWDGEVLAVATTQLNGRPVIISGHADGTVRVQDLTTGKPLRIPFTGRNASVYAVATARLNGSPVAISGSGITVRVWDLTTGQPIGAPFTGHTGPVRAVATTQLNGRPVVISGSTDKTIGAWDLTSRAHL